MNGEAQVKVSVILPVYNTEAYLAATLDSVLAQTLTDFEVILVDDGSTDGSMQIERAYEQRDARVRVIEQPNLRQGTARNTGLRAARGEYIYFMDSDDLVAPTLFEECYAACEADGLDFVTFDSAGFFEDPAIERPDLFQEMKPRVGVATEEVCDGVSFWTDLFRNGCLTFVCWLEFFRRDFLIENDLFFIERIYFEDNDWIVRVFLAAKRLRYLPRKLHYYREREGSNVHSGFKRVLAESCFDIHYLLLDLSLKQHDARRRQMVRDVAHVINMRFAQFGELAPEEDFVQQTRAFADGLLERVVRCEEQGDYWGLTWHLAALLSLNQGTRGWPGFDCLAGLKPETLVRAACEGWCPDAETRMGVYGTGRVCRILLDAFGEFLRPVALFETEAPRDKQAYGMAVHAIDDAADFGLDALIVASTRFQGEMMDRARTVLGGEVTMVPVTRIVFTYEWLELPEQWGAGA